MKTLKQLNAEYKKISKQFTVTQKEYEMTGDENTSDLLDILSGKLCELSAKIEELES